MVCDFDTPLVPGVPGSPGHLIPSDINPNGASELAALMREMTADLEKVRAGIESGAAPGSLVARHTRIRCSWPTDPGDRTPEFRALSHNYLTRLEALESAAPADRRAAFDAVVTACRSCHEHSCLGPIPRIEKLRL